MKSNRASLQTGVDHVALSGNSLGSGEWGPRTTVSGANSDRRFSGWMTCALALV